MSDLALVPSIYPVGSYVLVPDMKMVYEVIMVDGNEIMARCRLDPSQDYKRIRANYINQAVIPLPLAAAAPKLWQALKHLVWECGSHPTPDGYRAVYVEEDLHHDIVKLVESTREAVNE